jgi:hypothetical protein
MIDGDVVFDASFIRYWKQAYALLVGTPPAAGASSQPAPLAIGEVISPILAAKLRYGQPQTQSLLGLETLDKNPNRPVPLLMPATQSPLSWELARNVAPGTRGFCQFPSGFQQDFGLAAIALADIRLPDKPGARKPQPKDELPEEFVSQAIKHIVMHEVGHSLGLRHNFKASTMLKADQLNDTAITRAKGLVGSVMDYSPINIAPKGKKQGDFYSTTIGPYDYWAIEYAYKPVEGDEAAELKKIAARAPEHDLAYATDEDMFLNDDPYVNPGDLGSDPCEFGKSRIALASELLKDLDSRVIKEGESWSRTRRAFAILLDQWGDGATLAAQYVGGHSVSRDHKADKDARDPIVPVPGAKQRECLKFLTDSILSDKAFQFSPALLRRLGTERWMHWGSDGFMGSGVDISVLERILAIQKIVLGHCLSAGTLARIENQQLQAEPGSDPLRMDQVFRSLTDGIWSDLDNLPSSSGDKPGKFALSTIRRNLQREYVRRLSNMVLGSAPNSGRDLYGYIVFLGRADSSMPADARALARLHLKEINGRISKVLEPRNLTIDDTTRAHLEECRDRIAKVLEAHLGAQP